MVAWFLAAVCLWIGTGTIVVGAEEPTFVGYEKCKGCHISQFETWQRGKHAKAAEAPRAEQRGDFKCNLCHGTGAEKGTIFDNVQCEACHGPGSLYKGPKIMSKGKFKENPEAQRHLASEAGLTPVQEKVCLSCHGKDRPEGHLPARAFDYAKEIDKVRHRTAQRSAE